MARRARRAWVTTVAVAVLIALAAGYQHAGKKRWYESQVVMRIKETRPRAAGQPALAPQLKAYFWHVTFNNAALLQVMKGRDYLSETIQMDPTLALQVMRENINLSVVDDFATATPYEVTRSSKVTVRYQDPDPEVALKIARDLSRQLEIGGSDAREMYSAQAIETVSETAAELGEQLSNIRFELAELQQLYLATAPHQREEIANRLRAREGEMQLLEEQLTLVDEGASHMRLTSDLAHGKAGLSFEVLDAGQLAAAPRLSRREEGLLLGIVVLFMALPLAGVLVGTFDWRVRDLEGLARLGIKPFAQIPSFVASDIGSLARRQSAKKVLG